MRRIIGIIVLLVLLAGASAYYLGVFNGVSVGSSASAYTVVPNHAPLLFEIKDPAKLISDLERTAYWEQLEQTPFFKKYKEQAFWLDSLDLKKNEDPLLAALFLTGNDAFEFLWLKSTQGSKQMMPEAVLSAIGGTPKEREYNNVAIFENKGWTAAELNGVLVWSKQAFLVEGAIARYKDGETVKDDKAFNKVKAKVSSGANVNLFVNYPKLNSLGQLALANNYRFLLGDLDEFAKWSALDVNILEEGLVFTGYTAANDSIGSLGLIAAKEAPENQLKNFIPANTVIMSYTGGIGTDIYLRGSNGNFKPNAEYFQNWPAKEWAFFVKESYDDDYSNESGFAILANDPELALQNLKELNTVAGQEEVVSEFRGVSIYRLFCGDAISQLFNSQFVSITDPYYTILDNCLLFANTELGLRSAIENFLNNETLSKQLFYMEFEKNISTTTNSYVYVNPAGALPILRSMRPEYASGQHEDLMAGFSPVALQYSALNELIFTHAFLSYGEVRMGASNTVLWKTLLDTTSSFKPALVDNHVDGSMEIFTQDDANNIYLINKSGEVLWKSKVDGPILSEIYQIDYYKNEKLQYVFNTKTHIHIVDRLGNTVADYPLKMPATAAGSMKLIQYEDKKAEYRMFVGCSNGKYYGYEWTGKPLTGWSPMEGKGVVQQAMTYFVDDGKDYLVTVNKDGIVQVTDRQGENRFAPVPTGVHFKQPMILMDKKDGFTLMNGARGSLYVIDETGKLTVTEFANMSDSAAFNIVKTPDSPELAGFLEGRKLRVYRPDKSTLFEYEFDKQPESELLVLHGVKGDHYYGAYSKKDAELYLINSYGMPHPDFPVPGVTAFSMGDLLGTKEDILVAADATGNIVAYRVSSLTNANQ